MAAGGEFRAGSKVTVRATIEDPVELTCHTHVVIAAVVAGPDGDRYMVRHPGAPDARQYGPFDSGKLIDGW